VEYVKWINNGLLSAGTVIISLLRLYSSTSANCFSCQAYCVSYIVYNTQYCIL